MSIRGVVSTRDTYGFAQANKNYQWGGTLIGRYLAQVLVDVEGAAAHWLPGQGVPHGRVADHEVNL
jgi:hypothetical protein